MADLPSTFIINCAQRELIKDLKKPYRPFQDLSFTNLSALLNHFSESTIDYFEISCLAFCSSWNINCQKVTKYRAIIDVSFSNSPPIPDLNIGASLHAISGKLKTPILLLISIPDMPPLLVVHPNVNVSCPIVLLYNLTTGYWNLLKAHKEWRDSAVRTMWTRVPTRESN